MRFGMSRALGSGSRPPDSPRSAHDVPTNLREARSAELLGGSEIRVGLGINGNAAAPKPSPCSGEVQEHNGQRMADEVVQLGRDAPTFVEDRLPRELVAGGLELLDQHAELPQLRGRGVREGDAERPERPPPVVRAHDLDDQGRCDGDGGDGPADGRSRLDERAVADRHDHEEHERFGIRHGFRAMAGSAVQRTAAGSAASAATPRGSPRPSMRRRNDDGDRRVAVADRGDDPYCRDSDRDHACGRVPTSGCRASPIPGGSCAAGYRAGPAHRIGLQCDRAPPPGGGRCAARADAASQPVRLGRPRGACSMVASSWGPTVLPSAWVIRRRS